MFKMIFLSALRSLLRYKHISLINLTGLILGITSFLFIQHYLLYEFSFDRFISGSENIYRVNLKIEKENQKIYDGAKTPRAMYYALRTDIPEIEANTVTYFEKCLVNYKEISYANQDVLWVEDGFEKVFPLEMVEGFADYSRPRAGTISETMAKAYFGDESPIGKIIGINQGMPIEITGIFKDLPSNSHITAHYFASIKTWVEMEAISESGDWNWNGWWNYIKLSPGSSSELVCEKINTFTETYMSFLKEDNRQGQFSLQPLSDLHFISGIEGEMGAQTNRTSLYNLIAIAVITLIIAWINYVNLALAHAQSRSLQIGMRKLIGASKAHLWHQSLMESSILNIAALIVSVILYLVFVGTFARLFSIPIAQAQIPLAYLAVTLILVVITGILLSSIYHGYALSGVKLLPSHQKTGKQSFKNGLVLVQMIVSIIFLTSTIIVYKQIAYMKNKHIGIELNDVVICTGPASLNADPQKRERFESFKRELLSYPGFQAATFNMFVPGQEPGYGYREMINPTTGTSPDVMFFVNNASEGFINTYQMTLLAGKDFSMEAGQNNNRILINETALRHLGFSSPQEAVGKQVYFKGNDQPAQEVIGVVADFHNEGLQRPIYPIAWNNHYPSEFGYFAVRIHTMNVEESINRLGQLWTKHYPKDNFDFIFAKEQFNQQYHSESRFGKFYLWLTILSIGIAAIGLYGLIIFTFEKRTREISIRKVNGAKISEVLVLLNQSFIKWVGLAFMLATPLAWLTMDQWLQNFAFKTDLSWWVFLLSGLLTMGITLLTVSWQSWKAANRNPVEALRYE